MSSDDRPGELLTKFADWFQASASLVWVIDPHRKAAQIYRQDGGVSVLQLEDSVDGEDVVPGFKRGLKEILER